MAQENHLSDHCVIDHLDEEVQQIETDLGPILLRPFWLFRFALLYVDRKMHFTGFRGGVWRILGVDRSSRNPNICNI